MKTELSNGQQWHKDNTSPIDGSDKVTITTMTGEWEVRAEGHRYYMGVEPYYCDIREKKRDTLGFELHISYRKGKPEYWVETYHKALDIFGLGDYGTNSDMFNFLLDAKNFITDKIAKGLRRSRFCVKLDQSSSRTYEVGHKYKVNPIAKGIFGGVRYFESYRDIEEFYSNVNHSEGFDLNVFLADGDNALICKYKAIKSAIQGFTLVEIKTREDEKDLIDSMVKKLLDYVHDPEGIKLAYKLKEAIKELREIK